MLRAAVSPVLRQLHPEAGFLPSVTQIRNKKVRLRKQLWMPRAPSKLFKMHPIRSVPQEEIAQYKFLYDRHHMEMLSIKAFYAAEQRRIADDKSEFSQVSRKEEEELQSLLALNEEENRQIAALREQRHQEDFLRRMDIKMKHAEEIREKAKLEEKAALQELQKEMENLHFITHDTLDEAVKRAYHQPTTYNFAISPSGEKICEKTGEYEDK
ncbi:putative 28S ribosomal protein S26 [Tropilaelaps mercedesae]|uniref:Small ribosomal subunit protein mS26 n=1 Tax=Tropilaelaps mercedesae TaxID=418985 RepID=A0A1V9Y019_9ACAR|nr:putative 28S ribosomal protein S26 [Tropilaelaps mercedesae]